MVCLFGRERAVVLFECRRRGHRRRRRRWGLKANKLISLGRSRRAHKSRPLEAKLKGSSRLFPPWRPASRAERALGKTMELVHDLPDHPKPPNGWAPTTSLLALAGATCSASSSPSPFRRPRIVRHGPLSLVKFLTPTVRPFGSGSPDLALHRHRAGPSDAPEATESNYLVRNVRAVGSSD